MAEDFNGVTQDEAVAIEARRAERVIELGAKEAAIGAEMAQRPGAREAAVEAMKLGGTPVGFVRERLGLKPYWWQADVLTWFEDTFELVKGTVCTPNGAGKSAVIDAGLALWWITVHPQGIVVIISKDSKQLDNQLWPAIERHKAKFPGYDFIERMVRNGQGGFIIGFTTDDPGRVEGWHKLDDFCGPLLLIADEAKSVIDPILMALDRCTYNAKLLTSSPGLTEGIFWKSQMGDQSAPPLGYHRMKVGLKDCPHIPKSRIDNILEEYGADHWFTRSTLYGEFTDVDSDTLLAIPRPVVNEAMDNPPAYVPGGKRAFLDFAAGRNENNYTLREGNRITQESWKDPDPMRAVQEFIRLFVRDGLLPSEIKGDAGGMGIAILARFNELNWPIVGVHNESEPRDKSRYPNKGAEVVHNLAFKLRGMILPQDEKLRSQCCSRRAAPGKGGTLGLESKEDMKKRGAESPDRLDGLAGVMDDDIDGGSTMLDAVGLGKMEKNARGAVRTETGTIDLTPQGASYTVGNEGWLQVFERPIVGHSYICVVNPHRQEEQLVDHNLIVVRAKYWDDKEGASRPARLVARVKVKPFRLDPGPLAEMVDKVTSFYGHCICVPVANDRGDLIERLIERGIHIYAREDFEALKHGRTDSSLKFGWESDDYTRSMWIGALAEAIRQDRLIVEDMGSVMELYQLDGKRTSLRNAESLGVAVQLMNYATTYAARETAFRFAGQEDQIAADSMYS